MADKGPILTSGIIFYLSIGAAIFQILEEPYWKLAVSDYSVAKAELLKKYKCLTKDDLEYIVQTVTQAAGRGVSVASNNSFNNWNWENSVIFAATVITTIGYGNVAPKTVGGRVFCILYGLCGIPLCLTWVSEVGTFFSGRTKRLSQVLLHKGLTPRKVQCSCIALFLLWGLLVHLVIPPVIFMFIEEWSYLEGFHFCFTTLTTVGFGDYVAGVNPDAKYPTLYRFFVEMWIFMGLAWLSLFFSWNVYMVVEAHKVLKKRRYQRRHRQSLEELRQYQETINSVHSPTSQEPRPSAIDIFNYLTVKEEDYGSIIKQIGNDPKKPKKKKKVTIQEEENHPPRSKSCNDILNDMGVMIMEQSPRLKRRLSISDNVVFAVALKGKDAKAAASGPIDEESQHLLEDSGGEDQSPEASSSSSEDSSDSSPRQQPERISDEHSWDRDDDDDEEEVESPPPATSPVTSPSPSQCGASAQTQEEKEKNKEEMEDVAGSRFTVLKVSENRCPKESEGEG
ncbi:potassium channel subfamily K member 5b [Engraulis encrasicolus]|uniref:potassium channel subfamily K member 5b n=1 Tax=Engraulis encrasicolus TaxID=184585 RepID=UPI002FCF0F40